MEAYQDFSAVYDRLMQDVNYDGWCDLAENVFRRLGVSPKLMLELGCGTGNLTVRLAERGYSMIGLDLSPDMLTRAAEKSEGKDILYIAFSSGLSGTYNSIRMAAEELQEEYPERKLIVIDSLCACLGEGLLVYKAVQLKRAGKSLEEVAAWVEENKLHIMHNVTIDDLFHLHRGGRVSKASAIVGTMIQIKPIIHMDEHGELKVIGKERGRKKALTHIVDMAVKQSEGWDNDIVMITHGDCKEDAEFVARQVEKKMGVHNILINCIGTVIGSHTGPGVVAVFCMGNKR